MYRPHIPWALAVLLLASPCVLQAQTASDKLATLEFRDGVTIRKDSLFQLTMRFRIQNRIGFTTVNDQAFFGVYADRDSLPEADRLARWIVDSLDELGDRGHHLRSRTRGHRGAPRRPDPTQIEAVILRACPPGMS